MVYLRAIKEYYLKGTLKTIMAKTKTKPYDSAEYLETAKDMAAYLEAVLEDGDPRY